METAREPRDSTMQQRTPPSSLSESDWVGDLLDDLPRSWFTADGPAFLPWPGFTLFHKIVCCSGSKNSSLHRTVRNFSSFLHGPDGLKRWTIHLMRAQCWHLYITKLQRKNEIIRWEEHPYYINDIIWSRFGIYGSIRDSIPGYVEIVMNKVALGGFLWILRFPLPIPVLLIAPYLLIILLSCYKFSVVTESVINQLQKKRHRYITGKSHFITFTIIFLKKLYVQKYYSNKSISLYVKVK
jgi:hypothetical protein